jgi:hypothetical protein
VKETDIQKAILHYLKMKGIFAWRNQSVGIYDPVKKIFRKPKSRYSINGVSDILGILPGGKFLAIEVKRPKQKMTEAQWQFVFEINNRGGVAFSTACISDVASRIEKYLEYYRQQQNF